MPISALPRETVRLLGSPLVYSSPVAVVKELVDNALDAHATNVEVFISANTLDSIEVRDNGHGIHPDDFGTLGFRGCTSKLRNFDDIQTVGGVTLGFRGDALASATTLSTLTIVTRTSEDPTASKLYFTEKGGIEKVERVSAPVGTSVKSKNLFARLPVRRQCALKEASKTTSQIKDLLCSYAFARPHIKLAFRVLNQPKGSWSYSPGPDPSIKQAALQIFSVELASQCIERTTVGAEGNRHNNTKGLTGNTKGQGHDDFVIEAFLPKPGADPTKISKGAWFSVDSRPVSSSKGTIKTLYSAFKARLTTQNLELAGSATATKTPFVAVRIKCPPRSYDPNVEPSKDEVLFTNSHRLVEVFEQLLDDVYSYPPSSSLGGGGDKKRAAELSNPASEGIRHHDRAPHHISPQLPSIPSLAYPPMLNSSASLDSWIRSLTNVSRVEPKQLPKSPRMTIADIKKLDQGSYYKSPPSSDDRNLRQAPAPGDPARPVSGISRDQILRQRNSQDPSVNEQARRQPDRGWKVDMSSRDDDDSGSSTTRRHYRAAEDTDVRSVAASVKPGPDVNPWVIAKFNANPSHQRPEIPSAASQVRSPQRPSPETAHQAEPEDERPIPRMRTRLPVDIDGPGSQQAHRPMAAARPGAMGVPGGAYRSPMSSAIHRRPKGALASFGHGDRAFQPPRSGKRQHRDPNDEEAQHDNWFHGPNSFNTRRSNRLQRTKAPISDISDSDMTRQPRPSREELGRSLDLGAIRHRQTLAENRILKGTQGEGSSNVGSLERNGTTGTGIEAAMRDSRHEPGMSKDNAAVKIGLPSGDPRVYLMRKECSMPATTPRKLKRVKSCMLPLETTPAGEETYNLARTMQIDMEKLFQSVAGNNGYYVPGATFDVDMECTVSQIGFEEMQHRVRELLSRLGVEEVVFCVPPGTQEKPRKVPARV